MAKMTKKVKALIAAIVVVALLGGTLTVLLLTGTGSLNPNNSSADVSSDPTVQLVDKKTADIKSIHIKNQYDSYEINSIDEGEWEIPSLKGHAQSNSLYDSVAAEACAVSASKVLLEKQENLAEYGLDKPKIVAEITFNDDTKLTLNIGDDAPDGGSYMTVEGKDPIYIYDNAYLFEYRPYDFLDATITEAAETDTSSSGTSSGATAQAITVDRLEIQRSDLQKPIILVNNGTDLTDDDSISYGVYQMTSPITVMVDDTKLGTLVSGMFGLVGDAVEVLEPTAQQKKDRGFDKPAAVVKTEYKGKTYVLKVGNPITCEATDDPTVIDKEHEHSVIGYNVMVEGKNTIFRVSEYALPWLTLDYADIAGSFVVLPNIADVQRVTVGFDGKTHVFDLTHTTGDEDADIISVKYGDKSLNDEYFRSYYQLLLSMTQSGINKEKPKGTPIMTLTFEYTDRSRKADKLSYYEGSSGAVIIEYNGEANFLTKYSLINRVKQNTALIIQNKEIDAN